MFSVGSFVFEVFKVKIAKHRKWTPSDLVLQSDKGSEFKGDLQERFRKLRVKLVYSGPYHAVSRKIEVIALMFVL